MILPYLTMLRPTQWLKNLMLFFPPFLAGQALMPGMLAKGTPLFISFCMVSSAGYLFNDLLDRERDRHHPKKRLRSLTSGTVTPSVAAVVATLLLVSGLALAAWFSARLALFAAGYAVLSISYSLVLKRLPVVDLFCIAGGFLIRLQAGGELFQVPISHWLFLTVFLLAMFLSAGKRLGELRALGGMVAGEHRSSLARYPDGFLTGTMYLTGATVLVTYVMYTLQKPNLVASVPLCLFGLLRYLLRVSSGKGGDPTESLLHDWVLTAIGMIWVGMVFWSIYR